jgi:spore coat polysaccharide biosynthesis predicted glycosyltransferase SpsG
MNRDPILFRVDASPEAGYERLGRCLTFAAALQRRRRPTYFLSQLDPRPLGLAVKRAGSDWLEADGPAGCAEDLDELITEIRRLRPSAVIVDGPCVTEGYLNAVRQTGTFVACLDHGAAIRFGCHLVVNPLLAPSKEAYEVAAGTQYLLGPRYALVRPEIRRTRPTRSQEPPAPFSALVGLGDGATPEKLIELSRTLLNVPRLERVDLVLRAEQAAVPELQSFAAAHPEKVKLAVEPNEVVSRLSRCHFAVTGGGSFSLELACVGVPQLLIVQSESLWTTAQRLEEEGAATCVGSQESASPANIRQVAHQLLNDPLERRAMARCGRQLIDGRGPDRLVTALEVMLHPSREVRLADVA